MKIKFLKCLIVALCGISIVSCKQKEETEYPALSALIIMGSVSNDEGMPLESIRIRIDTIGLDLNYEEWHWHDDAVTDREGKYMWSYTYKGTLPIEEWPSNVTIIATDTTGAYETQTKLKAVEVKHRYDDNPYKSTFVDGYVTADFVMKKK